jgi:hypothetical protein
MRAGAAHPAGRGPEHSVRPRHPGKRSSTEPGAVHDAVCEWLGLGVVVGRLVGDVAAGGFVMVRVGGVVGGAGTVRPLVDGADVPDGVAVGPPTVLWAASELVSGCGPGGPAVVALPLGVAFEGKLTGVESPVVAGPLVFAMGEAA